MYSPLIRALIAVLLTASLSVTADAATITVYGLESVRIDNVFDPNARPQRLQIVSGALKLTGRNKWEMVSYIPRQTAAPKSDHGIYRTFGNQMVFYSFLTFTRYFGVRDDQAGQIIITKVNAGGQSQQETWYMDRPE